MSVSRTADLDGLIRSLSLRVTHHSPASLLGGAVSAEPEEQGMALADLVDHIIGVDPDRDRITAAVVCARPRANSLHESSQRPPAATAKRCVGRRPPRPRAAAPGRSSRRAATEPGWRRPWQPRVSSSSSSITRHPAVQGRREVRLPRRGPSSQRDPRPQDVGNSAIARRREGLRTLIAARDSAKFAPGRGDQRAQGLGCHSTGRPS